MTMCQMCDRQILNAIDFYCTACKKHIGEYIDEIEVLKKRLADSQADRHKLENTLEWVRYQHLYGAPMPHERKQDEQCVFCTAMAQ